RRSRPKIEACRTSTVSYPSPYRGQLRRQLIGLRPYELRQPCDVGGNATRPPRTLRAGTEAKLAFKAHPPLLRRACSTSTFAGDVVAPSDCERARMESLPA